MARYQGSPILIQLRSAKSHSEQTAALQALKNEVVGHIQRKEEWIGLGVLEPIVRALSSDNFQQKLPRKDPRFQVNSLPLSDEDGVKLQALQLIASFANGGPSFLPPLHAARALQATLPYISPFTNAPQIVVAALRALSDIVSAALLAPATSALNVQVLADSLFSAKHMHSLNAILSISPPNYIIQSQVTLASGLVCRLCREERHQKSLAAAGILDSLAARLASFAVGDGHVVPGAEVLAREDGLFDVFPDPAPAGARLGPILDAIGAILGDSKYRAWRLVNSPAILAVFPCLRREPSKSNFDATKGGESTEISSSWNQDLTAMEHLLPSFAIVTSRAATGLPPPMLDLTDSPASSRSAKDFGSNTDDATRKPRNAPEDRDDVENPIIPWLIYLVRSRPDYDRLMAASVLTALFKAGLGNKTVRETCIGLLVVPVLVGMIVKNDSDKLDFERPDDAPRVVLERAPAILARLITDSEYLQKAAFEADAIKVLSRLLRRAYKAVHKLTPERLWSAHPDSGMEVEGQPSMTQLGEYGQNPVLLHRLKVRESALHALGALVAGKEDYRKALVAAEAVPYIVESLSEFPRKPRQFKERSKDRSSGNEPAQATSESGYGTNPLTVIIAGCNVVRMLARSVSILRTALVDHAVAPPVFRYMMHPDVNVQIAATATIINLVVEVSPVRELLTVEGVMGVLCDHARSDNPALRLNALWALKHFVDAVGPELKKACLERLEPGWLVQLICDDPDPLSPGSRMKDTAGDDGNFFVDPLVSDGPTRWVHEPNGVLRVFDASKSSRLRRAEEKLAGVRESEMGSARRAYNDDVAIQEQGLDFIRNLIGRPGAGPTSESALETTEMIDYLFSEIGQDRLFEILASKVRLKVLNPFSRRETTSGRETKIIYPPPRIVVAVIFVLVHIAASIPRHRQLVVAQTELLKLLAQQSTNRDRDVRVGLCHLVSNLTYQEDGEEVMAYAQRAHELKKMGFLAKMESLRQKDQDLDVRERAKTAAWQMEQAIN